MDNVETYAAAARYGDEVPPSADGQQGDTMSARANEIEREIQAARADMSRTAAEIERRLQPDSLIDTAVTWFQRNPQARAVIDEVTDLAVRNPVPLLLIGLGAAWLAYDFTRNRPPAARTGTPIPEPVRHTDRPATRPAADAATPPPTADTLLGRVPSPESAATAAHVFADAGMDGTSPPRGA